MALSPSSAHRHNNYFDTAQRSLEQSAESSAVASVDPVTVIQVNEQMHNDTATASTTADSESGEALTSSPVTATGGADEEQQLGSRGTEEALVPHDKLGELQKQRSAAHAADALAANRLPIAITWQDVEVAVDLPAPGMRERWALGRKKKDAGNKSSASVSTELLAAPAVSSKVILDGVAGYCQAGQMLAIMGSSGAGTSTATQHARQILSAATSACVHSRVLYAMPCHAVLCCAVLCALRLLQARRLC